MAPKPLPSLTADEFRALSCKGAAPSACLVRRFVDGDGEPDKGTLSLRNVVMSTETPDRANDTVRADGWRVEDFNANPVLMWAHDYSAPPVGQVQGVSVQMGRLVAESVTFVPRDVSPFAGMIADMYLHEARFLRGFSVGFAPDEASYDSERGGVNFLRQSLLELSACSIPMNPECLSGAKSAGIDMRPLRAEAEKALDAPGSVSWMDDTQALRVYRTISPTMHQVPVGRSDAPAATLLRALESAARVHHLSSLLSPKRPAGAKES